MTSPLNALREFPGNAPYVKNRDVLVVFGELFSRGYANGIVDEAEKAGIKVIRSTVGRRDPDGTLRSLNEDELKNQTQPVINIPLEAGFDLEPSSENGESPVDQIKNLKINEWNQAKIDWNKVSQSRHRATSRFIESTQNFLKELEPHIQQGANVIFVHTMAGGVPRAKILMPTMNKVFKGLGDRYLSSEEFWTSELGRLTAENFEDVSASTFRHLIEQSTALRKRLQEQGGKVSYMAFGYHGTEVLMGNQYQWQSYAPYLQGWAKLKLEEIAQTASRDGVRATVFNCPEILTNSSSIFVGVEVPLYPLMEALRREGAEQAKIRALIEKEMALLKDDVSIDDLLAVTDEALSSREIRNQCEFTKWPQHNSKEQMETLIRASEKLKSMHKDPKNLITFGLSEAIFRATGYIMFHLSWDLPAPVLWLGHDVLAKTLASSTTNVLAE